ncbi:pyrroloquinoline quinone biosynthesis peptide chaperone PqqD [Methylobacillus gramineus]|uniref:pyrroloquinoline quinone biosynthesis peptide chaperone PqqD n=1 Tax=Methylobacillus gramineus TaxID=755169 RepID=UPI001CFF9A52|nr:pyrroloquinoline quinone biosynthesis peptide chaperone PqqD [Methylobacillus gramineus]MCB5184524.1 pyrroloquinoline quinone biosynthesis peptide chaperone PqqD [Methylobacillus gramineus]
MSTISDSQDKTTVATGDIYALARHYRFQWEDAQQCYVLLFPEGMIKLNGGAGEVIKRVDGQRTVGEIVSDTQQAFPDVADLESDIIAMLDLAIEKAWLEKRN